MCGPLKKLMSDTGNFISDKFRKFSSKLNIEQAVSSSYHKSNGEVDLCIKFEVYNEKCIHANNDINLAFLQIIFTPVGLLLIRPLKGLTQRVKRGSIKYDCDKESQHTENMTI